MEPELFLKCETISKDLIMVKFKFIVADKYEWCHCIIYSNYEDAQ